VHYRRLGRWNVRELTRPSVVWALWAAIAIASPARAQLEGEGPEESAEAPAETPEGEEAASEEAEPVAAQETEEAEGSEPPRSASPPRPIRYTLERIVVRGNTRTDTGVIRSYVPLREGEVLDVADPRIEAIEWRLLGTGFFDHVELGLERGTQRGHVLLVVQVRERNTFLVQSLALGFSEGVLNSASPDTSLEPYFGISLAELNLFGTGVSLELTALLSMPQQGFRIRAGQAAVLGSEWGLTGAVFFNNGREFFGNDDVIIAVDECPDIGGDMRCEEGRNAVVEYRRYGGTIGTGYDIATTVRFTLDYQLEALELVDRPAAASHMRGAEIVPIDFSIHDGLSWISSLQLGVTHDERDNPGLPTQGRLMFLRGDLSSTVIGSDYDFVRVEAGWREWARLPEWRHTLRFGLYGGVAAGDVPFFYKFYVGDLSDLIPSRVLELNLDRRAAPNLLDTSVREMRAEELAARIDVEYAIWLYEGNDGFRGLQLYGLAGLYVLMDLDDLRLAIPGYSGLARVPFDLTFDVGLRFDTVVGVFEVGFSTLLGFISI
jgi:outer membrane protein insertion porin family